MNFDFSPEQKAFGLQVRRLLERSGASRQTRAALNGEILFSRDAWAALANAGFPGAAISTEFGGSGLGPLEVCVAAEEIGRALAPVPSLSTVYLCIEALRLFGDRPLRARWLPCLADGTAIGAWAADGGAKVGADAPRLARDRIHGECRLVLDGMSADFAIVPAQTDGGETAVVLCELAQPYVSRRPAETLDQSRPMAHVTFEGAFAHPLPGIGGAQYEHLVERAAIYLAFEQIGSADRALEMARDYAMTRKSFGRVIGSYQAIKHKLAQVYANNQIARAHAYYGAWALCADAPEVSLAAAGARLAASQADCDAAQENIQTHGGVGFTWASDCHLHYRRARHSALVLGARSVWKARALKALQAAPGELVRPHGLQ